MSDYIPVEIVSQILVRLPVKLILKCKCVCKSWYSLITSPNFISMHTHFTINNNNNNTNLLLAQCSAHQRRKRYTLLEENESFAIYEEFILPLDVSNFNNVTNIGFCNGLLCFSYNRTSKNDKRKSSTIFLWNPSIRISMILPSPCIKMCDTCAVVGFGFDSNTNDYKVVRIVYHLGVHAKTVQLPTNKVEVYQISTGAWRTINGMVRYVVNEDSSQVFLNGAVHWLGYRGDEGKLSVTMVVFDIGNEVFSEIKFPGCFRSVDLMNMYLVSKGKSLSLIAKQSLTRFCLWDMEESGGVQGWRKQFTIDLYISIGRPLGFRKNGEILLGQCVGPMYSYNLKTNQMISFPRAVKTYFIVDIYMESLVLMRGANRVLGQASSCNAVTDKGAPDNKVEGSKRLKKA